VNNLSWTSSASFKTMKLDITKHVAGDSICDSDCLAVHSHPHIHLDSHGHHPHTDAAACSLHKESNLAEDMPLSFAARRPLLRSFSVGLIHGLAGSAAIAFLVLTAIPQPLWATLYLTIFCLGTIVGMGLVTTAIAAPFIVASRRLSWLHEGFVTSAGLLSFCFGLLLAYQIGVVDGLFSSAPI
jgi:hypothetical protein